ncbi:MAG TPA: DUF2330 domain-containing protein [Candidatus Obscuribacterales bacterium]
MQVTRIVFSFSVAMILTVAPAGQLAQAPAHAACCYFAAKDKDINQPGQKAFISWNPVQKTESFTVQPKFEGNAVDFGMVIPTPSRPKLDEMPRDFFKDLAIYTILMPLPEPIYSPLDPQPPMAMSVAAGGIVAKSAMIRRKGAVRVLESGVVGSLDYKIIVAEDAAGLFDWLKKNRYSYAGDEATLNFYIKKKWFFTVMKIDPKQMKRAPDGTYLGEVTPTRFTFSSSQCIYPLKITQISVKDKTDALFYVQAPGQMDLPGDWSWMHSYRPMCLTYMLGCAIDPQQQQELQSRNQWLATKQRKDPRYETTKLEWAKQLGDAEMSVLEDPQKNFAQMGTGDLPPGAKVISLNQFMSELKAAYLKKERKLSDYARQELIRMEDAYQPAKGMIVKHDPKTVGKGFISTTYAWYPAREAPADEVKGLTRLKGHLQKGQWLTKFRKIVRKDEMTTDLVLATVPKAQEQTYIRIMPTSPP